MQRSEKICPLCGRPNNCSVEKGNCWCFETVVPAELRLQTDGSQCICKNCIDEWNKSQKEKHNEDINR